MPQDTKALMHRWFEEVWNQGREETIDELFAADGIGVGLGESDTEVRGPAQFKVFVRNLKTAFPDLHISINDTIAEGDKVALRILVTGTHHGDSLGVPPTGRRVCVQGMVIAQIARGKIIAGWNVWDQLGMLQQLGTVPAADKDRFLAKRA